MAPCTCQNIFHISLKEISIYTQYFLKLKQKEQHYIQEKLKITHLYACRQKKSMYFGKIKVFADMQPKTQRFQVLLFEVPFFNLAHCCSNLKRLHWFYLIWCQLSFKSFLFVGKYCMYLIFTWHICNVFVYFSLFFMSFFDLYLKGLI